MFIRVLYDIIHCKYLLLVKRNSACDFEKSLCGNKWDKTHSWQTWTKSDGKYLLTLSFASHSLSRIWRVGCTLTASQQLRQQTELYYINTGCQENWQLAVSDLWVLCCANEWISLTRGLEEGMDSVHPPTPTWFCLRGRYQFMNFASLIVKSWDLIFVTADDTQAVESCKSQWSLNTGGTFRWTQDQSLSFVQSACVS